MDAGFWVFRSKKDGNRGLSGEIPRARHGEMQQRLDLILLRTDCTLVVLHPGGKREVPPSRRL